MSPSLLPHYNEMLNSYGTAYYRISKRIPVYFHQTATLDELLATHQEILRNYQITFQRGDLPKNDPVEFSYLDLKIEISKRMIEKCEFCENQCKVNRKIGEKGYCGISEVSRVSSAFLHHGEEPPLVPSGTIFFSGCSFGCVFCQNYDISTIGKERSMESGGIPVDGKQLAVLADGLAKQGAKNINYVGGDPTPNIHTIIESLNYQTNNITQLWNSNFYNSLKSLEILVDIMDFWLPDFKYGNDECAKKYSKITSYWEVLTRNLKYLYNWGSRDIIIRHLVMPGHIECCTKPILKWISKEMPGIPVNIMRQFHPTYRVDSENFSEINRRTSRLEMVSAFSLAEKLNIPYKFVS
jgi:putative pyruvate formate lyase activating enzyme